MNNGYRKIFTSAAALAMLVGLSGTAGATPAAGAPGAQASCPSGSTCFWWAANGTGDSFSWNPGEGNVYIGDRQRSLVDHVGSFLVNTPSGVCLQDTGTQERRRYGLGTWKADYLGEFGNRVDRVRPHDECL